MAESIVACLLALPRSLLLSVASGVVVGGGGVGGGGGGVSGGCGGCERGDLDLVLEVLIFEALTRVLLGVLLGELLRLRSLVTGRTRQRPRVLIDLLLSLSRALVF